MTAGERVLLGCEVVATGVLCALLSLTVNSAPRVAVSVYPHVVPFDGGLRLTCTVPRDADNRWLDYGVGSDSTSGRQLDGDKAPSVWTMYIPHVPCADTAWCVVTTNAGKTFRATTPLLVSNCDQ